ncbi:MAG: BON domain-containing protein [Candidatus Hydrogenedentes bacterium]|nr:BON domain-containing protein [Candidatus Hydrogenedentota bacterium]
MSTLLAVLVCGALAQIQPPAAVEDAAITSRISTMFALNEQLSAMSIDTSTDHGVVTLQGAVADEVQKQLATDLASTVIGVVEVRNELIIVPSAYSEKEQRNWRQKVNDATTSAAVRGRLFYHREYKGLKIGVETINGVVTLHGVVDSDEQKQKIVALTSETKGVDRVVDNLVVRKPDEGTIVQHMGQQISDEWLESRIETAITLNRYISIRELDVEVEGGTCFLTGTVDTEQEKAVAAQIAQSVVGVDQVQNDIRVRPDAVVLEGANPPALAEEPDPSAPPVTQPDGIQEVEAAPVYDLQTVESMPLAPPASAPATQP